MTPERYQRITSVLNRRQPDLTVITDEVHKLRNVSAVMRTCDAVGIDTMHIVLPKAGFRVFRGTALGTEKWVNTCHYDCVQAPIKHLKAQGFKVIAANLSDQAKDYSEIDYTEKTALLLGTENDGVSQEALALVDEEVVIPMAGMVASYNVSVAAAIILNEAMRQRSQKGLYDQSRLSKEVYQERLFCWLHPKLAEFCHENQLEYPELDAEGEVINGAAWYNTVKKSLSSG